MPTAETPTFRKDWAQAVTAGFEQINSHDGYGRTPTDDFLKGMAYSFQTQKRKWELDLQELGVFESVYCSSRRTWVYVIPEEAQKILEANKEEDEYQAKQAKRAATTEAEHDNKWYRKVLRIGRK